MRVRMFGATIQMQVEMLEDTPGGGEKIMRHSTTRDVLIEQNGARITVDATFTPDTETGDPRGWAISYRVPDDGVARSLDDAVTYSVISPTGHRAQFVGWRKVGRRRLGIGIGAPPVERV